MNPIYRFYLYTDNDNLFSKGLQGTTLDAYVTSEGKVVSALNFNATGFIQVGPNNEYLISALRSSAWYDSDQNFISAIDGKGATTKLVAPDGAYYLRCSVRNDIAKEWDNFYVYPMRIFNPVYKDDLSKDYELETNQRFYRAKLSGKLAFLRGEYDYIYNQPFDAEFRLLLQRSDDLGNSWKDEFTGKFYKTDCTFNADDRKVQVQPDVLDQYNNVLAGIEKEYNLVSITPKIERLLIKKRPLIQVYIPGDSVVSCFLGGTYWEQDANATTDRNVLVDTYHFALCNLLKEINVTLTTNPNVNALYSGRMSITNGTSFSGNLYPDTANGYYIYMEQQKRNNFFGTVLMEIRRSSDNVALYRFTSLVQAGVTWDNLEFDAPSVDGSGATGSAHCDMATYNIYVRYLLDVSKFLGLNTYPISDDDIVSYNRNYKYAIGYTIDVGYISNRHSDTPTEWGIRDDGTYFEPPYIYGKTFYPIARSTWRYASIWFSYIPGDEIIEAAGRKSYTLRDAYPVSSVIQSLLNQFAPEITHEDTEEYSQFLYGDTNPIAPGQKFRLMVTQKSNLLVGDYQAPAKKSPATLQQFTNMLRDTFQLYWYIEDNKFKIEHISFFKNGGSYTGSQNVGIDLTELINARNGKKWGYDTSEWSFDKIDMAERYQFKWMDDVTEAFEGQPIEILSKYVTEGKIEEVNVSNFTSDVDIMILNPTAMSNDGFALFAAVNADALDEDTTLVQTKGTNGLTKPAFDIREDMGGEYAILSFQPFKVGDTGAGQVVFYNNKGTVISRQGRFSADGTIKELTVLIPDGATSIGLSVVGTVTALFNSLRVLDKYELPFVQKTIQGVNYVMQNGYLSYINLQPNYWTYNLPAKKVQINGDIQPARGIQRLKKQTLNFPVNDDFSPDELVKTYLGNGEIDKMSINLSSRTAKTTLKYDTE